MDIKKAYNNWALQYDTNDNKTRDLEAKALRTALENMDFDTCLEIGCGTGKNTEWLITKAKQTTAVDFSVEMLAVAKEKVNSAKVQFIMADITDNWTFAEGKFDLVCFSLVLEHIEDLEDIFSKVSGVLVPNGYVYIGELHPFKQYMGTKARYNSNEGEQVLTCFNHNISDFINAAKKSSLEILHFDEHFDNNDRSTIPRIMMLLLRKK
jgi:ubiquinone/menaquinone biosynthesis C-methylase UbiE